MNEIKSYLGQFIFSLKGAVIAPVVMLGVTMFFGWLVAIGVDIPPEQAQKNIASVSNIVANLLEAVLMFLFVKYVVNKGTDLQKAAGMPKSEQDGWVGEETIAHVKEIRKEAAQATTRNPEVKTMKRGPFLRQTDCNPNCHE